MLTWCAGPPRGCDAALRPRGRATGGPARGASGAQGADTRQVATQSTRSTRAPVRGATWQTGGGWQMEGPR